MDKEWEEKKTQLGIRIAQMSNKDQQSSKDPSAWRRFKHASVGNGHHQEGASQHLVFNWEALPRVLGSARKQ